MKSCIFCGTEFPDERPYDHCTAQLCVERWMAERRGAMSIALLPKQGFEVVYRKDSASVPWRSSGR
jgi:hypothetical protein